MLMLLPDFFEVAILFGACFIVNYVTVDAKTNWTEGYVMVSFYVMIVSEVKSLIWTIRFLTLLHCKPGAPERWPSLMCLYLLFMLPWPLLFPGIVYQSPYCSLAFLVSWCCLIPCRHHAIHWPCSLMPLLLTGLTPRSTLILPNAIPSILSYVFYDWIFTVSSF